VRERSGVAAIFALGIAVVVAVSLIVERSRFLQGFIIATVTTSFVAAYGFFFVMHDGNYLWLSGAWAEDIVNDEIRRAIKSGHVWGVVQNVEFGGFDIDHLVVAPGGVFAVETKSRSSKLDPVRARTDRKQTAFAAAKAKSILRSVHVRMPQDVTPVLAISGRSAVADLPAEGRYIDGVHVVAVAHLGAWLAQHQTGRLAQDDAETMLARLNEFKKTRVLREPVLSYSDVRG
jgi:Nuclease-related domain